MNSIYLSFTAYLSVGQSTREPEMTGSSRSKIQLQRRLVFIRNRTGKTRDLGIAIAGALWGKVARGGLKSLRAYGQTRFDLSPPLAELCTATGRAASAAPALPPSRIRAATRRASISACRPEICAWKMAIWFSFSFIASYILVIVLPASGANIATTESMSMSTQVHRFSLSP